VNDRLWDWALKVYGAKDVAGLCLELQDDHDHCVPLLLWAMWLGAIGVSLEAETAEDAVGVARAYHEHVIAPLRGLKRKLKSPISDMDDAHRLSLREEIKGVELKGEAALMQALESLMGKGGDNPAMGEAGGEVGSRMSGNLIVAARAWNPVVVRPRLLALNAATVCALGF
jgi:uncharacterized protein (TIGR02444 family)